MAFNLQSFRKTLLYEATPFASQLQANFRQIAVQDKQAEKKRTLYLTIAIISAISAFLSIIFAINGVSVFGFLFPILLVTAVVTGVLTGRWNRLDVPDIRYELPVSLADVLGRDMAKNAPLAVHVDFSKPTEARKKVSEGPWSGRSGWKQVVFEDPWMRLSGRFLDETTFTLTLMDHTVVRSGWKRSRSGKSKHKTKTKPKGNTARILLAFPRKKYGAVTVLQNDLPQAVNLPPGVTLKKVKANDHQLVIEAKVPPQALPDDGFYRLFTQMLLSAYQGLNLSKELSKVS